MTLRAVVLCSGAWQNSCSTICTKNIGTQGIVKVFCMSWNLHLDWKNRECDVFWLIQRGNCTDFGMVFFFSSWNIYLPIVSFYEGSKCLWVQFENQHTLCYYYSVGSRKLSWSVRNTVYSRDIDALYIHFERTSLEQVEVLRVIWCHLKEGCFAPSSNHGI